MILFRLPFENKYYTTNGISDRYFVEISSFSLDKNLKFYGNIVEISEEEIENIHLSLKAKENNELEENQNHYIDKINKTIDFIKENHLSKLVISRKKLIHYNKLNISQTFTKLVKNYPSAFVYAFQDKDAVWIGAFSELLGKYHKSTQVFETMSLAGTLPINENWTEKEIEEQKPVSQYINNILSKYSQNINISETRDDFSGQIKHLRTDFECNISKENLENLIQDLHPTPAVCGIPKDFCKDAIKKIEDFDREFYAGFSKIETEEYIYYFVNLRCGKFYQNSAEIFAGGGITALSNPEKEWRETELKADNLIRNLVF